MCCWTDALQQQVHIPHKAPLMICLWGELYKCNHNSSSHWHTLKLISSEPLKPSQVHVFCFTLGVHGMHRLWWNKTECHILRPSTLRPSDLWSTKIGQFLLSTCTVSPDSVRHPHVAHCCLWVEVTCFYQTSWKNSFFCITKINKMYFVCLCLFSIELWHPPN